jgi:uncharacterized RDD family membrane protein YckC
MQRAAGQFVIAPPGLRLAAFFIDLAILFPINLGLALLLVHGFDPFHKNSEQITFRYTIISIITQALYYVAFVSLLRATPGKLAFGLRIARIDGQPLMPDTAILRYLIFLVGNVALGIGSIVSAFLLLRDPARRAVHDRVAGTVVVAAQRLQSPKPSESEAGAGDSDVAP